MRTLQPEFIVVAVVRGHDNLIAGDYGVLVGRCGDAPIPKGTIFSAIYEYGYPNGLGALPVRLDENSVRLEVVEIQTYNRSFDQLGEGMTGSLIVRGDGLDRLRTGWVVGQAAASAISQGSVRSSSEPVIVSPRA